MIQIIKEINVEVTKPNIFQALVAKQYDMNTRFLKVTLMDCGDRINVPATETTKVVINAERKDGQSKGFDGVINEDGTVTVPLHSWMLELDGVVNCDISVIDTATDNNKKLTTTTFALLVEKAAYGGDGITSDPQYDVLIQLINDCNEVYQNFLEANDRVDSLEADVEGLKQSSVTKDYVDSHLEGVSDLVSDNQDDIRNLGERTVAVETSLETLKRTYVDTQRFEETSQGLEERITYAESDIIQLEEDIVIIREDFATKKYVDDAIASGGGGTGGGGVSSWNDLTDKPFYDEKKTATLDYANPPAVGIDFNGVFLGKVTDDLLTTDHIDGAEVSIYFPTDSTVESISEVLNIDTLMMFPLPFGTGYQLSGDNFFCMIAVATQTGEVDFDGMTYNIPETGTYLGFMHYSGATPNSMSLEYELIKTLDIKFIPDSLYTKIDQRIENYISEALGGEY